MARSRALHAGTLSPSIRLVASLVIFFVVYGFQMLGLPQPITGPGVNALLLLAALIVGPWYAMAIGALTPVVAFARGILAAPLAPMIPFIALGNAVMIGLFSLFFSRRRAGLGVAVAAIAKFALLATVVRFVVDVPQPIAVMMQWPQLITALAGGYLVLGGAELFKALRPNR